MSAQDPHQDCASRLTSLEIHDSYLRRDIAGQEQRIGALESQARRFGSLPWVVQDLQDRLRRLEEAIRLIKLATGLAMMAVAASGQLGGAAERMAKALAASLLGVPF